MDVGSSHDGWTSHGAPRSSSCLLCTCLRLVAPSALPCDEAATGQLCDQRPPMELGAPQKQLRLLDAPQKQLRRPRTGPHQHQCLRLGDANLLLRSQKGQRRVSDIDDESRRCGHSSQEYGGTPRGLWAGTLGLQCTWSCLKRLVVLRGGAQTSLTMPTEDGQ